MFTTGDGHFQKVNKKPSHCISLELVELHLATSCINTDEDLKGSTEQCTSTAD